MGRVRPVVIVILGLLFLVVFFGRRDLIDSFESLTFDSPNLNQSSRTVPNDASASTGDKGNSSRSIPSGLPAPVSTSSGFRIQRPKAGDSLEDILKYKKQVELGMIPDEPLASRNFPTTPAFELVVGGGPVVLQAALNEVYVPRKDGQHEIVEIAPVTNLQEWQAEANQISPDAELVLYRPDLPQTENNALMLGNTLILAAANEEEARSLASAKGLEFVRPLGDSLSGRYLVSAGQAQVSLEALLRQKTNQSSNLEGNFRKVLVARARAPLPPASKPARVVNPRLSAGRKTPRFIPNDANFTSQWHLYQTSVPSGGTTSGVDVNVINAWDLYKGAGVTIGIVDDGLQLTHPDLSANISSVSGVHHDWNDSTPTDPSPSSLNAHGTAVAGVSAARGNNSIGVSGVAP